MRVRVGLKSGKYGLVAAALIGLVSAACSDAEGTVCGDGVLEGVESCDDGNRNNDDGCLVSCQIASCGDGLVFAGVEACDDGNEDDSDGCTTACTLPICGDGFQQAGEDCDDGNLDDSDDCLSNCTHSFCGDGVRQAEEGCDDGNLLDNDACLSTCLRAGCGDGAVWAGVEACDDGNQDDGDTCTATCGLPTCGDGVRQPGEACDDGNLDALDACLPSCLRASCGDGQLRLDISDAGNSAFEACDDGNLDDSDACLSDCRVAVCGDGERWVGVEACDDGNDDDTDGCTSLCTLARCGDGLVQDTEECDDGNSNNSDSCTSSCTLARCGDGHLRRDLTSTDQPGYEGCDDGNLNDGDACTDACQPAVCGDGAVRTGVEACDDGNSNKDDGCTPTCALPSCGNLVLDENEECDDGNSDDSDDCLSTCIASYCGDGVRQGDEGCDDGNVFDDDACLSTCVPAGCGDGVVWLGIEACDGGGPDSCTEDCALPSCGDGITQAGEGCDDGNLDETDDCLSTCLPARCGDGVVRLDLEDTSPDYEACDDGNAANNDACLNDCALAVCGDGVVWTGSEACDDGGAEGGCTDTCRPELCGDGLVQSDESCDDGNLNQNDECSSLCLWAACGDGHRFSLDSELDHLDDGTLDQLEMCDDGNRDNGDACLPDCSLATCGDGVVWRGVEGCDDGNPDDGDACLTACVPARCGDGVLWLGRETCDDGNRDDGDACTSSCSPARCGDGLIQRGVEACDDGNTVNTDACVTGCNLAACGDGFLRAGVEICDDGNTADSDACLSTCVPARCGDGVLWQGQESCDDGNLTDTDSCLSTCEEAQCGDGLLWHGVEVCDDGNSGDNDACLSNCTPARCGDGVLWQGHESCDDANDDNTDNCLINCEAFQWCDRYEAGPVVPAVACETSVPEVLDLRGSGFYVYEGTPPHVTLNNVEVVPTINPADCQAVGGVFADVVQCSRMSIPAADLGVGNHVIRVTEPLTAACEDVAVFSVGAVPSVERVEPPEICEGTRTLSFRGSGFVEGTAFTLEHTEDATTLVPVDTRLIGPGELEADFRRLEPGWYDAIASNGVGCETRLDDAVEIIPEPLTVFVDPPVLFRDNSVQVTIFLSGLESTDVVDVLIRPSDSTLGFVSLLPNVSFDRDVPSEVKALIPADLTVGDYDVLVRDSVGCEAPLRRAFAVTDEIALTLTGVDPPAVWRGTPGAISLLADPDAGFERIPSVFLNPTFGGEDAVAARLSGVGYLGPAEITALVPANLPADVYDVIVVNPSGAVGSLPGGFRVLAQPAPTIVAIAPTALPRQGEQTFVIEGSDFRAPRVSLNCEDRVGADVIEPPVTVQTHSSTRIVASLDTALTSEGWICVVRATNPDEGGFGEFSALSISSPSGNIGDYLVVGDDDDEPRLAVARRAPATTGGGFGRNRFIWVMGGDNGAGTSFNDIELITLDRFGNIVTIRTLDSELWLPDERTLANAETIGRFIYLLGGRVEAGASETVIRAEILDPVDVPQISSVRLVVNDEEGLVQGGVWYYRVSAVMDSDDLDNPDGETLASEVRPIRVPGGLKPPENHVLVELAWPTFTGADSYRVYRTPSSNLRPTDDVLLGEVDADDCEEGVCLFEDDGIDNSTEIQRPRAFGDLGRWVSLTPMSTQREGPASAWAREPDAVSLPDRRYLYTFGGRQRSGSTLSSHERLTINLTPTGSHLYPANWVTGNEPLSAARWQLGVFSVDRTVTNRLSDEDDTYFAVAGGLGGQSVVDSYQVLDATSCAGAGNLAGCLSARTAESSMNPGWAGFGNAAIGGYLIAFGGQSGQPSTSSRRSQVCSGGVGSCLDLSNWPNNTALLTPRYLPGTAVEGSRIFLVGGVTSTEPLTLSDTIEIPRW